MINQVNYANFRLPCRTINLRIRTKYLRNFTRIKCNLFYQKKNISIYEERQQLDIQQNK